MRAVLLLTAALAITAIFASAMDVSPFPIAGTTIFAGAVVVESTIVLGLLRASWPRPLWSRALIAAFLGMVTLWFSAQDTLGAPEYVFMHQRWLATLIVGSLVVAVASALAQFHGRNAA